MRLNKVIFVFPFIHFTMRITLRVFGSLVPLLGEVISIDLEEGATIGVLKRLLFERLDRR
ncbi:hypothetical protein KEJ49_03265, partial [Candidatus Bathyarchaeota archaeon]|nr:hypothetical protein [Candidatus Bathyarchaeota archaeon]